MNNRKSTKIFCIGLGKTGTSTFAQIMRGQGSSHKTGPHLNGLVWHELRRYDKLFEIINRHESFDDFPYPYIYEECFQQYENSLFVLTTRSSESRWFESLKAHHLRVGATEAQLMAYGCSSPLSNEEKMIELYLQHNQRARDYFADTDQFIEVCWEKDGEAERISEFLGLDEPLTSIPRANAAADKSPGRVIENLLKKRRYGTAIQYARSLENQEQWLVFINQKLETLYPPRG